MFKSFGKKKAIKLLNNLGGLLFLLSFILTSCGAVDKPAESINWVLVGIAIGLAVILVIVLSVLIKTGRFLTWFRTGLNANKWNIEQKKLFGKIADIQNKKEIFYEDLGEKVWVDKVIDPSYAETFLAIDSTNNQKVELENDIQLLLKEQEQTNEIHLIKTGEYSKLISDLKSQLKEAESVLNNLKSQQVSAKKQLTKLNKNLEKNQGEFEKKQTQLREIESPASPDQVDRVESLTNEVKALEVALNEDFVLLTETEGDLSRFELEHQAAEEKIISLNDEIVVVETQQSDVLHPLEERTRELKKLIENKKVNAASLKEQMPPLFRDLGTQVDTVRPQPAMLGEYFARSDDISANLAEATQEHRLVLARLETTDESTLRNYWMMIMVFAILIIAIVVLLIMGL